jgi:hypothetical protein
VRRRELLGLVRCDRVVPEHAHLGTELLEEVDEVVRKAVVVVDHQQHALAAFRSRPAEPGSAKG